jgi:hypothetical protein
MGFFGRLMASIQLIKESWKILKKDKELLLYPLLSGIIIFALMFVTFIPVVLAALAGAGIESFWIAFIVFYFLAAIVGVFFTAALMGSANMRLNGKDPRFSDGISIALKVLPKLIAWALITATIGLILKAVSDRNNVIARVISAVFSVAWSLLTLFMIPVILFEKKGPISSIRRSGELFAKTWGEAVIGQFSISALFALGILLSIPVLAGAAFTGSLVLVLMIFSLTVIFLIVLYLITASLSGIYTTALYNYASKKKLPKGFSREFIKAAFVRKS